jgi:hypothetical protein
MKIGHDWPKRLELAERAGLTIGPMHWDLGTRKAHWLDEIHRQFGYTRETFSGRREDLVARIYPEDRSAVEEGACEGFAIRKK